MKKFNNKLANRLGIILLIPVLLIFGSTGTVAALSAAQKQLFDEGIDYYNTDSGTAISCSFGSGSLPSAVPSPYNGIFTAAGTKFNVAPALIAGIFYGGEHGHSWPNPPSPYGTGPAWASSGVPSPGAPDWPTQPPGPGAAGPFQFEYPTWQAYGVDANGDGNADVEDLQDASFAAAKYLGASGAKGTTDAASLQKAIFAYNHSQSYVDSVMAAYQQFSTGGAATSSDGGDCSGSGGGNLTPVKIIQDNVFGNGDGLMGHQPTMIGLHYTAANEQTVQDVINDLKDPTGSKNCNHITHSCSVQLTVLPDGSVYQLTSGLDVKTENIINFNDADVGIEIAGKDESTLLANKTQFNAVVSLVAQLMQQYNIKMQEDFLNKTGLMGHVECDDWSQAHIGTKFTGAYEGDTVESTDSHQDPGPTYMSNIRSAVGQVIGT